MRMTPATGPSSAAVTRPLMTVFSVWLRSPESAAKADRGGRDENAAARKKSRNRVTITGLAMGHFPPEDSGGDPSAGVPGLKSLLDASRAR
ncbi:hypothetical protein BMS3Abin14_01022 [bacterium BMS3Abin14]|nr:hypothetical protein BMS3Abin14_01022 [bacterium BMS3Abin14]